MAQIVVDILEDMILKNNDVDKDKEVISILDPTVGSGTFLAFAMEKWMHVIGYNINDKCVQGSLLNLKSVFEDEEVDARCQIRVGDSTKHDTCNDNRLCHYKSTIWTKHRNKE